MPGRFAHRYRKSYLHASARCSSVRLVSLPSAVIREEITLDRERLVDFLAHVSSVGESGDEGLAERVQDVLGPFLEELFGPHELGIDADLVGVHRTIYDRGREIAAALTEGG